MNSHSPPSIEHSLSHGLKTVISGIITNIILAAAKIGGGITGHSFALIADGIESLTDIFVSLTVLGGLRYAALPPDEKHPYGHGKAEALAGLMVSAFLIGIGFFICWQAVDHILHPIDETPTWIALAISGVVIVIKEFLFRKTVIAGENLDSTAIISDAWHHRSDALSSGATFIGIGLTMTGISFFRHADYWAAIAAGLIIIYNGIRTIRPALDDIMDAKASDEISEEVKEIAASVPDVIEIEKHFVRKSGFFYYVDIHVIVDKDITVKHGHDIAGKVKHTLLNSPLKIKGVLVHIEPSDD